MNDENDKYDEYTISIEFDIFSYAVVRDFFCILLLAGMIAWMMTMSITLIKIGIFSVFAYALSIIMNTSTKMTKVE